MSDVQLAPVRHIVRAIATAVVPESASLDDHAWSELDDVIDRALSKREQRVSRQLVAFLRLLQTVSAIRYGRPLTALSPERRHAFLESVERSRFVRLRRGFWGVRTLILMGYYTRNGVEESIGYNSNVRGWAARGGTVATVPLAPMLWVEP
jgi:hypothetical protein